MTEDDRLERTQWDLWWLPGDTRVVDRPEVQFVACPRDVPHLNAVNRTRATHAQLPAIVDEVVAAHATVTSRWLVGPGTRPRGLEQRLAVAGYRATEHMHVYVLPTSTPPAARREVEVRRVTELKHLTDAVAVLDAAFDRQHAADEGEHRAELERLRDPTTRVFRFVAYLDGEPVAAGGLNAYPDLDIGLLWGGGTIPAARGRGAYGAVLDARVALARELGLGRVGLYARDASSGPIVAARGFRRHGPMIYWHRPPG